MNRERRKELETKGWKIGGVEDFLRLTDEELEQSADKLAPLYASDPELTIFTALDGEDPVENLYGVLSDGPLLTEDLLKERARDLEKEEEMGKKRAIDD